MTTAENIKGQVIEDTGASPDAVGYITDALIEEMNDAVDEDDEDCEEVEVTLADGSKKLLAGVYCNSLVPDSGTGGYLRYKRGPKGTSNYGCGSDRYKKSKSGTTYQVIGSCSGGRTKYLVSW